MKNLLVQGIVHWTHILRLVHTTRFHPFSLWRHEHQFATSQLLNAKKPLYEPYELSRGVGGELNPYIKARSHYVIPPNLFVASEHYVVRDIVQLNAELNLCMNLRTRGVEWVENWTHILRLIHTNSVVQFICGDQNIM